MISICNYDFFFSPLPFSNSSHKHQLFVGCFIRSLTAKQSVKLIGEHGRNGGDKVKCFPPPIACRLVRGKAFSRRDHQQTYWAKPLSQSELGKKVQTFKGIQVAFLFFLHIFRTFLSHLVSFTQKTLKCFFISQAADIYRYVLRERAERGIL